MFERHIVYACLAASVFALAAAVCVPRGLQADDLLSVHDDPAGIADRKLGAVFDRDVARLEIEVALAANDSDLAKSFLDLAHERDVPVTPELTGKVTAAVDYANSATGTAESFARGLITGEPDDAVSLAGTALGDLFVLGDIRDAVREGSRYVSGGQADELVLGLACVGIAVTAGTYATFGAAAPARIGLSAIKVARKAGRIGGDMAEWMGRTVRGVMDWPALRRAGGSLTEPAIAIRTAREAVKVEKADGLVRFVGDIGRVQARAGTKAALDGLKVARGPADVARVAKLAEKKGSKTRAVLKMLGTGALFLSVTSFHLAAWIFGAAITVLSFVCSMKAAVERWTLRHLRSKRERRLAGYSAPAAAQA